MQAAGSFPVAPGSWFVAAGSLPHTPCVPWCRPERWLVKKGVTMVWNLYLLQSWPKTSLPDPRPPTFLFHPHPP